MIIPLWALLVPAAIIVFIVVVFAGINLLQLHRFGFFGTTAIIMFLIFLAIAGIVSFQTIEALRGVDWNAPFITARIGTASDIIGQ